MKKYTRKDGIESENIHIMLRPGQHNEMKKIAERLGIRISSTYQKAVSDFIFAHKVEIGYGRSPIQRMKKAADKK